MNVSIMKANPTCQARQAQDANTNPSFLLHHYENKKKPFDPSPFSARARHTRNESAPKETNSDVFLVHLLVHF